MKLEFEKMKLLASLAILKSVDANITCYSCVASRGADGSSLGVSDDRLVFNPYAVGMFELLYEKSSKIQNRLLFRVLANVFYHFNIIEEHKWQCSLLFTKLLTFSVELNLKRDIFDQTNKLKSKSQTWGSRCWYFETFWV